MTFTMTFLHWCVCVCLFYMFFVYKWNRLNDINPDNAHPSSTGIILFILVFTTSTAHATAATARGIRAKITAGSPSITVQKKKPFAIFRFLTSDSVLTDLETAIKYTDCLARALVERCIYMCIWVCIEWVIKYTAAGYCLGAVPKKWINIYMYNSVITRTRSTYDFYLFY